MGYPYPNFCLCNFLGPYFLQELDPDAMSLRQRIMELRNEERQSAGPISVASCFFSLFDV